jgi:iron(III) transport system permease protein
LSGALGSHLQDRTETTPDPTETSPGEIVPARRRGPPWILLGSSLVIAAVLLTPFLFLVIQSHGVGLGTVWHLVWRPLTATLLWNTVSLTVVVTVLCAAIGTLTAWCVERTDLPGRRVWAVLLVVPFAIPDLIVSFGWASLTTAVHGFQGAVLIMTLTLYPLVYLFVAASLRSSDPGLEEAARGLGLGRVRTFVRVTLVQSRGAILGACVVVALILLAEYGAFEDLGFQTFTTEIFAEFQVSFNVPGACALSFVLLLLAVIVLGGDALAQGRGRMVRTGRLAQREIPRHRLGRATIPVEAGLVALVGLALGVPIGASFYWMFEGGTPAFAGGSLVDAALTTLGYSAVAAAAATVLALPLALLAARYPYRGVRLLERSTFLVLAMPGLVIALALSYFSEHEAHGFAYQSAPMVVVAYAMLFFPLALVGVRASAAYAPVNLEQAAASLGQRRLAVFFRVTLPLLAPGLATAFCLVFLAAVTELTATLILIPTGVQTLASQFWAYEENLSYGQAAPYALVMIAIVALPAYVLARYFQRLPRRATGAG